MQIFRIGSFIFLSLVLHLLLLPLDFMSSMVSVDSRVTDIGYVSRKVDFFYPGVRVQEPVATIDSDLSSINKTEQIRGGVEQEPLPVAPVEKKVVVAMSQAAEARVPVARAVVLKHSLSEDKKVVTPVVESNAVAKKNTVENIQEPLQEVVAMFAEPSPAKVETSDREKFLFTGSKKKQDDPVDGELSLSSTLIKQEDGGSQQPFKDALPRYDINPLPRYPDVARRRGWEGTVLFVAMILENGRIGRLNMVQSSGYRSLDSAARKAIKRWTFIPATSFGKPIDSEVEIPFSFSLKNL